MAVELTSEEGRLVHEVLLKTYSIEKKEFETECKFCGRKIMMCGLGSSWTPMSIKTPGKVHKCKPGKEYYKP